ncbi:MAG: DUF512 domain-containing protein, partial [Armatimonadota bacterium]|nr:DUF512 domain-containing protein [Armatimonadota bacterium]
MKKLNSKIACVAQNSPADKAGIRPGDILVSLNGRRICDILDYQFYGADEKVVMEVLRNGSQIAYTIYKDLGEDLGIEFVEELFDGVRMCRNRCIFCFLDQMPPGLRKSLYVRDDDFRLSFAHGNYITLTNLEDDDFERIISQKMSPLYVSVHSTDPNVREYMLGNKNAGRIMRQLEYLAEAKITVHAQIVLCPGINDEQSLERTVSDLSTLYPSVASVAIVPVGLTRYRDGLAPINAVDSILATEVLNACKRWQKGFLRSLGTRFVFAADEFYFLANKPFPSRRAYEGFPQLEDGVGLSRLFLDELKRIERWTGSASMCSGKYVLVTGILASNMIARLAEILNKAIGIQCRICIVKNKFFGETVTVAGLLTGNDIADALRNVAADEIVLIPSVALKEGLFLDDMSLDELGNKVGARIDAVEPTPVGVFRR